MPQCGSQCYLCDVPIRFDTYKGCSHFCAYCFVTRSNKGNLSNISKAEGPEALRNFIEGKRTRETAWCDWSIPLHWGGTSDPFQPAERELRNSYECLKVFAETKYPFIVSTKGAVIAEPEYLELLRECNAVVQISMCCPEYDRIEKGAPPFEQRLAIAKAVAPNCLRLIIRIQPFMHEVLDSVLDQIPRFREAGAYGVIVEGMKFFDNRPGLVKIGSDYTYPYEVIEQDFRRIEQSAHEHGLKCYAGENRLRGNGLGDSLTCCGIEGLESFVPNRFNINHIIRGEAVEPTPAMRRTGGGAFRALYQDSAMGTAVNSKSFEYMMKFYARDSRKQVETVFGLGANKR